MPTEYVYKVMDRENGPVLTTWEVARRTSRGMVLRIVGGQWEARTRHDEYAYSPWEAWSAYLRACHLALANYRAQANEAELRLKRAQRALEAYQEETGGR